MSTIPIVLDAIPSCGGRTVSHLQEALRGKLRANACYLEAGRLLAEAGLHVIAHAFRFTAAQEGEHAAVLRGLLTAMGAPLPLAEDAASLPGDPTELLRLAEAEELADAAERLPRWAGIAEGEGHVRAAKALRRIAGTDGVHARRFAQYRQALAEGSLFRAGTPVSWVCLGCGELHTGCEPPEDCPGCSGGRGYFIRSSFYPFSVEE